MPENGPAEEAAPAHALLRGDLRPLLDATPDAMVVVDHTRRIVAANRAAGELFGYERGELVGGPLDRLVPEAVRSAHATYVDGYHGAPRRRPMASGQRLFARRKDGTTFRAEISLRPMTMRGAELVVSAIRDVSERARRSREQRRQRQRHEEAQRIAHLGHWVWDMSTGALEWSDEVYRIFGVEPGALEPTLERFMERVHPEDRAAVRVGFTDINHEMDAYHIEHRIVRPGGEERVVEERGQVTRWTEGGAPAEMTGTVLDVTERARLERQLRQAQKMEVVGTLAGGVAHDFNNILHSVGTYVHLTRTSLPAAAHEQTYLDRVEQGLGRATKLVRQLLTFSRQEGAPRRERVRLADRVEEALDLLRPTLPPGTELRLRLPEAPPVGGDPDQIQQVLMNLLTNAAQALGDVPESRRVLDVTLGAVDLDAAFTEPYASLRPGPHVRLTISDTGPGMDAATRERIFEPFFTTKAVGEGTGLGLAVVHGIVQNHDGVTLVCSEPGVGTTFHLYLPARGDSESGPPETDPPESVAGAHVLVVDDDRDVVEVEAERLRQMGYVVTGRFHPDAALETVRQAPEQFDALVADYAMPGMSGLDLIRAVRPGVPAILWSGVSAQVGAAALRDAGVDAFLHKPVPRRVLHRALDAART